MALDARLRKPFQFSLASALVGLTAISVAMAYVAYIWRIRETESNAPYVTALALVVSVTVYGIIRSSPYRRTIDRLRVRD